MQYVQCLTYIAHTHTCTRSHYAIHHARYTTPHHTTLHTTHDTLHSRYYALHNTRECLHMCDSQYTPVNTLIHTQSDISVLSMCMCMYMHIFYIYIYIDMYKCIHTYLDMPICIYIYVYMFKYAKLLTSCTHACMFASHAHIHDIH